MTATFISNLEAQCRLDLGALLVDIREEDERARAHIPGSLHAPLSELPRRIGGEGLEAVIFYCGNGMDSRAQAERLAKVAQAPALILEGGLTSWRKAGLPVRIDEAKTLDVLRQVHVLVGSIVVAGVVLGYTVTSGFFGVAAGIGAALIAAGSTGECYLAHALHRMPWNRGRSLAA